MQVNLEAKDPHTIEAYSEFAVRIDGQVYEHHLIVSHAGVEVWPIQSIQEVNTDTLAPFLFYEPEMILIGHNDRQVIAPVTQIISNNQAIAVDVMGIGPACRTYNILLSEGRRVVLGIVFGHAGDCRKNSKIK